MNGKIIVLVEDNPDDEALTLCALNKNNIMNEVVAARDGVEALGYLFAGGEHAGLHPGRTPALTLLDLKLPKVDGFEVLRQIRAGRSTRLLPVAVLTSSKEEQDITNGCRLGANSRIREPVDFGQFMEIVSQLGRYRLMLNETASAREAL